MSGKNIITENHSYAVIANEICSDDKSLCKTIRTWLYGIG